MKKENQEKNRLIKKDWQNFGQLFLVLAFIRFGVKFLVNSEFLLLTETAASVLVGLQFITTIGSGILIAYYSYKFSHKKVYLLTGLLGIMWGLLLPVLIGLLIVERLKRKALSHQPLIPTIDKKD